MMGPPLLPMKTKNKKNIYDSVSVMFFFHLSSSLRIPHLSYSCTLTRQVYSTNIATAARTRVAAPPLRVAPAVTTGGFTGETPVGFVPSVTGITGVLTGLLTMGCAPVGAA